jgi:hypothetical protein
MARPRLAVRPVRQKLTLCLRPGEDDDLIAYLNQAQVEGVALAQAVIAAMRGGLTETTSMSVADIDEDLVDELLDMVF